MGTREQMVSRIWNSTDLWSDLAELCGFGGRFCGTPSEARAREYLRERLAAATGAPVTGRRIGYEGWQRESCRLARLGAGAPPLHGTSLVRSPATPAGGLEAEVVDLGRGTLEDFRANEADIDGRIVLVRQKGREPLARHDLRAAGACRAAPCHAPRSGAGRSGPRLAHPTRPPRLGVMPSALLAGRVARRCDSSQV